MAGSDENSDGVRAILQTYLRYFPSSDSARAGAAERRRGRAGGDSCASDEGVRWADVAPFLGLRFERDERVDAAKLQAFRQGIAEMMRITDAGILALARAGAPDGGRSPAQYALALGSELGDLFREREAMRELAERSLMPERCVLTWPIYSAGRSVAAALPAARRAHAAES